MTIPAAFTSYFAAATKGTYTVVDRKGTRIVVTVPSDIINKVHKARQHPKRFTLLHSLLTKLSYKLHKFIDSDFFYK